MENTCTETIHGLKDKKTSLFLVIKCHQTKCDQTIHGFTKKHECFGHTTSAFFTLMVISINMDVFSAEYKIVS